MESAITTTTTISTTTMPESEVKSVKEIVQEKSELVEQVTEYSFVIIDSLYMLIGGMFIIFVLHKLVTRFLYPHIKNKRFIKVVIGTLYVLVLVISVLLALRDIGFEVHAFGPLLILGVLVSAIILFFLLPFFPRLPFKIGHMIEVNGVLGIVDAISSYHITIRTFDGSIVFIPNALVMASRITNYHDTPERRIEMKFIVKINTNFEESKSLLLKIMEEDDRVLSKPAEPTVFIVNASATGIEIEAFCWVKNEDWLSARSELWQRIINAINEDKSMILCRPQREIYVLEGNKILS